MDFQEQALNTCKRNAQTQSKDFWRQDIIHSNDHNEKDRLILEECNYFFNMVKERPALFILSLDLSHSHSNPIQHGG